LIGAVILWTNANKLPLVVQRTMSFLPVKVDPIARGSAEASTQWRLEIWKQAIPQVPKYLLIGKGYSMDPNELYLADQSDRQLSDHETILLNGDYHSGPLSVIIPLGVFGAIGFVWFLVAAGRFFYRNHRFGDPRLQRVNTFLLAFFIMKVVFFFFIFGSLYSDLYSFTGLVGLSVSLNGRPEPVAEPELTEPEQSPLEAFS
jgi:O-antigen ligase